jgi:predicted ATPase
VLGFRSEDSSEEKLRKLEVGATGRSPLQTETIPYWQRAGQRAIQHSAHVEAISHLTKGLELLTTLPDTPERAQQELTLQLALGAPLIATKGYTAPEVGKAYTRALELCRQIGETPQLFLVLGGLAIFYGTQGEIQTARELEEQRMRLAQSVQDPVLLLEAYHMLGTALFWFGEFASAQAHLEQSIMLYDSQQYSSYLYLHDPKVHCLAYTAYALWHLGYPDQALERISKALILAREFPQAYTQAWVLLPSAILHQYRREEQLTQARAEGAITLSTNLGFPAILAMGTTLKGWALAEQGQGAEGIAQLREGIAAWSARFGLQRPHLLALLAEAYGKVGQPEEGLTLLTEALAQVEKTGERFYEAELYRLKGELTLQQFNVQGSKFKVTHPRPLIPDPQAEAEACFQKAIELARKQGAKSLELRAVTSLARLWQQQGKTTEAQQLLSEIYGWFTEGFDTKDLQEAKALLESLSS